MKKIYILRHAKPIKSLINKDDINQNKNIPLDKKYIKYEKDFINNQEYKNINNVYTSDYVRTIQTGKLINKNITIDERLGERIAGIPNYDMTPEEYFYKQINSETYKFSKGESRKKIENRMHNALVDILEKNDEAIIITHGVALTFLLMKFCDIKITNIENKTRKITFKNKIIFENKINYLETFKLTFNENNELVDIESLGGLNEFI